MPKIDEIILPFAMLIYRCTYPPEFLFDSSLLCTYTPFLIFYFILLDTFFIALIKIYI